MYQYITEKEKSKLSTMQKSIAQQNKKMSKI